MEPPITVTTLFLDIGGVLLTRGWGRDARMRAAERFDLDFEDLNDRHHMTFATYEEGKLSLDEYLNRVVFYQPRPFIREAFKQFMFDQSQPYPEMLAFVRALKATWGLKIAAISNEGRELAQYRIDEFGLREFVDFFVISCFVHTRKPDADIYRIALDISQSPPDTVVYLDDRAMFVEVAQALGIGGIHHLGFESTRAALADLGLTMI